MLHEPNTVLLYSVVSSLYYIKMSLNKIIVKLVTYTYCDISGAAVGCLQKLWLQYVCKDGGWFTSPAAPDRWLSGYWVIIIKMKHPVGKPEPRMLLLQVLFNNYKPPQTDPCLSFPFPQVTKWEAAVVMKKKWVENMGKWRKKNRRTKTSSYTHTQHTLGSPLSYHLCFFLRFILWRPFWIRVAPCLP